MCFLISNQLLVMHFKANADKNDIKTLKVRIASLDDSNFHMQVCFTPTTL